MYYRDMPYSQSCLRQGTRKHIPTNDECANTPRELQQMLQVLADESRNQCLKMNKSKKKVMMENETPMYVNNTHIENVESYI